MRRIYQCLNSTTTVLCQQTLLLEALQEKVAQFLPLHLQTGCCVAQFSKGQLVLSLENPIHSTELRYLLPALRDRLRTEGRLYQLSGIKIKLQAEPSIALTSTKKIATKRKLSITSQQCLDQAALLCDYTPLKNILLRIGR